MIRNIAIVGAHTGTKFKAPYDDKNWEIWSSSPKNENELPRVDVGFEIHRNLPQWAPAKYMDWLASLPAVYMCELHKDIPGSVLYPKDEILERFGRFFFEVGIGSTPSWMMALAITKKPPDIVIWGCHGQYMSAPEKPGIRHFMQVACDEGIEIICQTPLNEPGKLYGFD